MKQQYENICPLCGHELKFQGDQEIVDEVTECSWDCPHCKASGIQVNNIVFDFHADVVDGDGKAVDLDKIDIAATNPPLKQHPLLEGVLDMIETDCGEHLTEIVRGRDRMEIVSDRGPDRFVITVSNA